MQKLPVDRKRSFSQSEGKMIKRDVYYAVYGKIYHWGYASESREMPRGDEMETERED